MAQEESNRIVQPVGAIDSPDLPSVAPLSRIELAKTIAASLDQKIKLPSDPELILTTRRPYLRSRGDLSCIRPTLWAPAWNGIVMLPVSEASPAGVASILSGTFEPLSNSHQYVIAVRFTARDNRMYLDGPWGRSSSYVNNVNTESAVAARWGGGEKVDFEVWCNGAGFAAYIFSVEFYRIKDE
jgi:hypothetical protein